MRWFAPLAAVALGGCNLVFGLEAPGGGAGDGGAAIDAPGDPDGARDARPDGGGGATLTSLVAGAAHTCVVYGQRARCWGRGNNGQLGGAATANVGDDEPARASPLIELPGKTAALAAGGDHTCALVDGGDLYCWGAGARGQLGYGNTLDVGDDEPPLNAGIVPLNAAVSLVAAGGQHTCALTLNAELICWGNGGDGRLGYGASTDIGDNETAAAGGALDVPEPISLATGGQHTCAIDGNRQARCWGHAAQGQLGYGNTNNIGDNETPASAGAVAVATDLVEVVAGDLHTCALDSAGKVRCWGFGANGRLGTGNQNNIGDNELPSNAFAVDLGGVAAVRLAAGGGHTCALMETGAVRCWGQNDKGQLGYGHTDHIGDNESVAIAGEVALGDVALSVTAGRDHTCALLSAGVLRCWGANESGQLGYGTSENIGDDEVPGSIGPVPLD